MVLADLLAAATTGNTVEGVFLQYGLIGAVALVLGIYTKRAIDATDARAKRLEDDNRRLYMMMADQMIPALTKATDAVALATTVMTELRRRDEINAAVEAARNARAAAAE